jgi:molybdopterin molybdotransferase
MNNFQQIQEKIKALQTNCVMEEIELKDALNRVLREDVLADNNMPPFDKSAMDGYACRLQDIENSLELLEVINAGVVPTVSVGKNQCSKIMTGAKVPEGADCVFKVEESEITESGKIQCTNAKTHKNICYLGEDYKKGEVLIKKGAVINVSHMAVLAGAGYQRVKVTRLPKIAVITTGTELVEPHENPSEGKIRNTNASQLLSQLAKMNLAVTYLGIFADDYDKLSKVFIKAIADNDFVFFTGGASVGDFDWIPKILEDQKFEIF